ncbi:MAG: translation elongation factor Ts [Acholeplasmataceae bacterium]|nr:translation elongation factor Ts [Acholeplasmataceae bacterium]
MDIKLVKKLREETGAGMLECKKALEASNDDYEIALSSITANMVKVEGNTRVASKGLCSVVINENQALLFELNAETDFVAKNEHFINLVKYLGDSLIASTITNPKDALKFIIDGISVETKIEQVSGLIKEKIVLRRLYRVVKDDTQTFGTYIHQGGKVVTLIILNQGNQQVANELAMQIAANSPLYLSPIEIDSDTINYEKFMYEKNNGSFDETKFEMYLKEVSLLTQDFIKNPEIKVEQLLNSHEIKVIDFFRFELGQGIENKLNCKLDIPCDGSQITVTPIF